MYFAQKAKFGTVDEEALALTILPTYALGIQIGTVSFQIMKQKRSIFNFKAFDLMATFEYQKALTHTMVMKYSIQDIKVPGHPFWSSFLSLSLTSIVALSGSVCSSQPELFERIRHLAVPSSALAVGHWLPPPWCPH